MLGSLALAFFQSLETAAAEPARWQPRAGERIALVGNGLAERMNLYGHFETLLHARWSNLNLVVRNFGWPADEVGLRQRPDNYTHLDDPLQVFAPETFLCFFGWNESFAGTGGLARFEQNYGKLLDTYAATYAGKKRPPAFVLVSPIAFEDTGDPLQPRAAERNAALVPYVLAISNVAARRGAAFVNVFDATRGLFDAEPGAQHTVRGYDLTEAGDRAFALILDRALGGTPAAATPGSPPFERLRAAVNDKAWIHFQDYRMLNGWYVYGGRRTLDTQTFPREYTKVRSMAAVRDRYVWDRAQGRPVPPRPDDRQTGDLFTPPTGYRGAAPKEPPQLVYAPAEAIARGMHVATGLAVTAFASEKEFPALANPVQMNFDARGRLWVACMPTYPQWKPGDPHPTDRLIILEDANRDGKADAATVFYDQLHNPTGFEFWNGGVLVVDLPRILFLKDTDGDDRADVVQHWSDGWASDDTHHAIGAWEWSPGGLLHLLEGVNMSTTVETPWGPYRHKGSSCAHVLDPRTFRLRYFDTPGFGNPWCYVFDEWGQGIVGDGTGGNQLWDSPLSGAPFAGRGGLNTVFNNHGLRPVVGSEIIRSRHFPDDLQGRFTYACVINMNGLPSWTLREDGSGFGGTRAADLLKSDDRTFRPIDPQIGPDGALWIGDWCNALIGHMQYSQRDPSRDKTHGRVYRLTAVGRPLVEPELQHGRAVPALLDQLRSPETRTRYRARRELRARPASEVLPAVRAWVAQLDAAAPDHARLLCEALWVQQGLHAIDAALVDRILQAADGRARAAAVRALSDAAPWFPGAFERIAARAADPHPRVRLEAVRALSFFPTPASATAALAAAEPAPDYWLDYTLDATLRALRPAWVPAREAGDDISGGRPAAEAFLNRIAASRPQTIDPALPVKRLLNADTSPADRAKARKELARVRGNADKGRAVFQRVCIACHKLGATGMELGPDLSEVGKRLDRAELIESLFSPNAKITPGFQMVNLETKSGQAYSGYLLSEDKTSVVLRGVAGPGQTTVPKADIRSRTEVKVSSMPEGLPATMSPAEIADLIAFLSGLR